VKNGNLALLLLVALAGAGLAEEKTLIGDLQDVDHGGFGGPIVKFTQIGGEFGVLTGGRGGWIIDHRFVLGGGGYGLSNSIEAKGVGPAGEDLEMGYGGAILEYVLASDDLVHLSFEWLIGAGGTTTVDGLEDDAFFVTEPGVNLMLNVTKFFRCGAGVSYRYVQGADFGELDSGDLSGMAGVLTFKFGSF
jgi:hypothetical protein